MFFLLWGKYGVYYILIFKICEILGTGGEVYRKQSQFMYGPIIPLVSKTFVWGILESIHIVYNFNTVFYTSLSNVIEVSYYNQLPCIKC